MQGPHAEPPSSFVTGVSSARRTLDEAAGLLVRFWKVSLPTDGQCTLHCEQVGGGTRTQRLQGPPGLGPAAAVSSPGPGPRQLCLHRGNVEGGREASVRV